MATDAGFTSLVLDTNEPGERQSGPVESAAQFLGISAAASGSSIKAAPAAGRPASFSTVPPLLQLTYPAGGETWQRFQVVTIRWVDNLSENVALDIYKSGVSNRTIVASTPSSFEHPILLDGRSISGFRPGRGLHRENPQHRQIPALFNFSPPFSLITNLTTLTIDARSVTNLPDGSVQFGFSIPGALSATVMDSTNSSRTGRFCRRCP